MKKKVSIIIPVYNGENYLREAINSALNQTYENFEVLVVNDGSDDNGATEQIALSYGDKITYYKKENGGVATALNYGIKKMTGEYFSWLSHDDMYMPNKIKVEMDELQSRENEEGIIFSNFISLNVREQSETASELDLRYPIEQLQRGNFAVWVGAIHGCSLLIHKSNFDRAGLFDINLKTTQDYALWYKMFQGERIEFTKENLVISRVHPEQGSKTIKEHEEERKRLYNYFIDNISIDDINWQFQNEYKFCADMIMKFMQWGFAEERNRLQEKIMGLEEPIEIQFQINKFNETLKKVIGFDYQKLCLFGAGGQGRSLLKELRGRGIKIDYFIDNDEKKQGTLIDGIRCITVDQIEKDTMGIIVTMDNNKAVLKEFISSGIKHYIIRRQISLLLFNVPSKKEFICGKEY